MIDVKASIRGGRRVFRWRNSAAGGDFPLNKKQRK